IPAVALAMRRHAASTAGRQSSENPGMQTDITDADSHPEGVLAGARAWIITDGKAGMDVQARGVADALGLDYEMKRVAPRGIWRVLAPWGPVSPADRPGSPGSPLAPPWPAVAIATGRAS